MGTLIHGLLEHAMSQKKATAEDLHGLGMWLTVEQPQLRQVLELAVKTVLYVSKSDFWDEAKRSDCSVECGGSVCSDRFFGLLSGKIVQLVVVVAVGM
jgi:hypothetical protein